MNLYEEFERQHEKQIFSLNWNDVNLEEAELPKAEKIEFVSKRKDLSVLESELAQIEDDLKLIAEKKLRLANLAKFYE
ncbi:MAG: hypothetical protein MJ229_02435 [bacterium]|nr:hypothetical protein [bacterium]